MSTFSLAIERRPLTNRAGRRLVIEGLPIPPSLNNLFPTGAHGKRYPSPRYVAWRADAEARVRRMSGIKRIPGPVFLTYWFKEQATRVRDLGNLEKATTDLLVNLGIIEDDNRKIVRGITLLWGDAADLTIEIRSAE